MTKENKKKNTITADGLTADSGRLLPQARELEEAVIGAILIEKTALDTASEILSPEMFYDRTNELIFTAICDLKAKNEPVDMLTIVAKLRNSGTLEVVGGVTHIAELSQKVISTAHLEHHCRIIQQKYIGRKSIEYMNEAINQCFDETYDIDDVISEISLKIEKLQETAFGKVDTKQLRDVMRESVTQMYERAQNYEKGQQTGINTGIADLNRIMGGWQKSNLIIIAGRPSMGKTAIALHFAKSAARSGIPVVIFELEMTDVKLTDRLLLSESSVDPNAYKVGRLTNEDVRGIDVAVGRLYDYKIQIDSNPVVSMDYIRNRSRLLKKQGKCEMIVIDYLQLIDEPGSKNSNREQVVAQISRKAKLMAKELNVPVILLAQLSREVEKRGCKRPVLSDLRESGAIEQDADLVIFIYREEYYNSNAEKGKGTLIISKYRDGFCGDVDFSYNESMTKIFDYDSAGYSQINPSQMYKNYQVNDDDRPF